jgi:hypothetical protein
VRALALATVALAACRQGSPAPPAVAETEEGRFPHATHAEIDCVECHPASDVAAGRPARPGTKDHAPCDRDKCHRADFLGRPTALCEICHSAVDPLGDGTRPAPYPPETGRRALAANFDHQRHLDFAAMEEAVGFHVSCSDCHGGERGQVSHPGHAACGRCHAAEAAPEGAPPMSACAGCHAERQSQPSRRRALIAGDLRFRHRDHRSDRRGQLIRCVDCHVDTAAQTETGAHPPPPLAACVACHDDDARVPPTKRMRVCETCHATRQQRLGALAPRSHLPASERPIDHTLAFRRDHGDEATRDATRCARCHTAVSGATRDVCDECHRVMRPSDHVVSWREYDHGPDAAVESERCARCHSADYCVACHRQPPRSHFPLADFGALGGHGVQARLNMRACITCHPQATFCSSGAGCHPRVGR